MPEQEQPDILAALIASVERVRADREPCPKCGGNRLRADFTTPGRCHVPQVRTDPAVCVCCGRALPTPNAKVTTGPIHFDCWDEHHSDPHASHGCRAE